MKLFLIGMAISLGLWASGFPLVIAFYRRGEFSDLVCTFEIIALIVIGAVGIYASFRSLPDNKKMEQTTK